MGNEPHIGTAGLRLATTLTDDDAFARRSKRLGYDPIGMQHDNGLISCRARCNHCPIRAPQDAKARDRRQLWRRHPLTG
jgi:hypothetical protein